MIDKNFITLDTRVSKMIREAGFKLGAIFFAGLIFGGLILMLIWRAINKKVIISSDIHDKRFKEQINVLEQKVQELVRTTPNSAAQEKTPPTPPTPTTMVFSPGSQNAIPMGVDRW